MSESPIQQLIRWEEHGAEWRVVHVSDEHAIVDLCTCYASYFFRLAALMVTLRLVVFPVVESVATA